MQKEEISHWKRATHFPSQNAKGTPVFRDESLKGEASLSGERFSTEIDLKTTTERDSIRTVFLI